MIPDPAGFTVDGSDPRTWAETSAAALTALATEFDVVAEPPGASALAGPQRVTWLDTFDWRLHKAGLTLRYVPVPGGGELRLSGAGSSRGGPGAAAPDGGTGELVQLVTGWQASRPHLAPELADGPVSGRLAALIAPRALIPVASLATAATAYRLLNEDRKTVARLLVSRPELAGPRAPAALAPQLTVTEVRGYQGRAHRATRLIAAVPCIRPATGTLFDDALRVLGRRRGDYSNKVDAPITAAMPAAGAAAGIALRLLDTLDANVSGVLADTDTEFLHDLRVSVRRTRSALKLLGDSLTGLSADELAFFSGEFKWVGDLTTPTRDLDVHLLDFEQTAHGLAAAKPDDLEPFRGFLRQRRSREFRALTRGLRSERFRALTRQWRVKLTDIQRHSASPGGSAAVPPGAAHGAAARTIGLLAAERTRMTFVRVAKRGAAITPDSPAESLHDLRKRCKELRYALEFFAPLHDPAASGKVVGDLKRLQDCLGEFQDTEIQISEIRALGAAMLALGEAPAVTLLAMGEITAGLAARQRAARADFERRFAAFAGVDGQRRMSALLRGRYLLNADIRDL